MKILKFYYIKDKSISLFCPNILYDDEAFITKSYNELVIIYLLVDELNENIIPVTIKFKYVVNESIV